MFSFDVKMWGVSWCCGNYCWLAFVLWCGYCSVSFQSFVLRHWCPQHQETTKMCEGPKIGVQGVDTCATNVLNTSVNHNNYHQIQMFLVYSV